MSQEFTTRGLKGSAGPHPSARPSSKPHATPAAPAAQALARVCTRGHTLMRASAPPSTHTQGARAHRPACPPAAALGGVAAGLGPRGVRAEGGGGALPGRALAAGASALALPACHIGGCQTRNGGHCTNKPTSWAVHMHLPLLAHHTLEARMGAFSCLSGGSGGAVQLLGAPKPSPLRCGHMRSG